MHNSSCSFDTLQLFQYYDAQGNSIGQSQGNQPDKTLFNQAHYVVSNQATMLKNDDSHATIQEDIESFRQDLVEIPLKNISEIMQVNRTIRALSDYLDAHHLENFHF